VRDAGSRWFGVWLADSLQLVIMSATMDSILLSMSYPGARSLHLEGNVPDHCTRCTVPPAGISRRSIDRFTFCQLEMADLPPRTIAQVSFPFLSPSLSNLDSGS